MNSKVLSAFHNSKGLMYKLMFEGAKISKLDR